MFEIIQAEIKQTLIEKTQNTDICEIFTSLSIKQDTC